jgi:hypothetical protein
MRKGTARRRWRRCARRSPRGGARRAGLPEGYSLGPGPLGAPQMPSTTISAPSRGRRFRAGCAATRSSYAWRPRARAARRSLIGERAARPTLRPRRSSARPSSARFPRRAPSGAGRAPRRQTRRPVWRRRAQARRPALGQVGGHVEYETAVAHAGPERLHRFN